MKRKNILAAIGFICACAAFACGMLSVCYNGNELVIAMFVLFGISVPCAYCASR